MLNEWTCPALSGCCPLLRPPPQRRVLRVGQRVSLHLGATERGADPANAGWREANAPSYSRPPTKQSDLPGWFSARHAGHFATRRPLRAPHRLAEGAQDSGQRGAMSVPVRTEETTSVMARTEAVEGLTSWTKPSWLESTVT